MGIGDWGFIDLELENVLRGVVLFIKEGKEESFKELLLWLSFKFSLSFIFS